MLTFNFLAPFQDWDGPHCSKCLHKRLVSSNVPEHHKCSGNKDGTVCMDYVPPVDPSFINEINLYKRKLT